MARPFIWVTKIETPKTIVDPWMNTLTTLEGSLDRLRRGSSVHGISGHAQEIVTPKETEALVIIFGLIIRSLLDIR